MALSRRRIIQDAEKLVQRGRLEAAISEYRGLLEQSPDDTQTLNRVGDLYLRLRRVDEAVDLFRRTAEHFSHEGFYVKAIAIYKKIIRVDPTRIGVYEALADLYYRQGLLNEARSQYQVVADYHAQNGETEAVAAIYQKLIELEPEDPSPRVKLADLYLEENRASDALEQYRQIAKLMLSRGRPEQATRVYLRALEVDAEDLAFVTDAVLELREAERPDQARQILDRAAQLNPKARRVAELAGLKSPTQAAPPASGAAPEVEEATDLETAAMEESVTVEAPAPVEEAVEEPVEEAVEEPAAAEPEPEEAVEEPAAAEPEPEEAVEEPVAAEPEPEEAVEKPAAAEPEPVEEAVEEPVAAEPKPVEEAVEEPVAAEPEPEEEAVEEPVAAERKPAEVEEPRAEAPPLTAEAAAEELLEFEIDLDELETPPPAVEAVGREEKVATEPAPEAMLEPVPEPAPEPEVPVEPVAEAAPEPEVPVEPVAEAAPEPEVPAEPVAEAAPEPEVPVEPVVEAAPEPEVPVEPVAEPEVPIEAVTEELEEVSDAVFEAAAERTERLRELVAEAKVLAAYGIEAKAAERFEQILELEPGDLEIHGRLLEVLVSMGPPARVVEAAERARAYAEAEPRTWEKILGLLADEGYGTDGPVVTEPERPIEVPAPPPAAVEAAETDAARELPGREEAEVAADAELPVGAEAPVDEETSITWLEEIAESEAAAPADEAFEEEFFDLGAALERELEDEEKRLGEAIEPAPVEQTLEEIVEGFKKGVAETLSPEDYDTHYNLGIAYREMGLLDEAIGEFQLAAKDPRYLVDCCSLLGACFREKGFDDLAAKWYRRGLESPHAGEQETLGLLYELGNLYLELGKIDEARSAFVEIYGMNSNYRDVVARLEEVRSRS